MKKLTFAVLIFLIVACNQPVEDTATLTQTAIPTEVSVAATPTQESIATVDPNYMEYPVSWWTENFAIAQSGDSNVGMTTTTCALDTDEQCLETIDYCPDSECIGFLVVWRRSKDSAWLCDTCDPNDPYYSVPGAAIGENHGAKLFELETFVPHGLFATDEEREILKCELGVGESILLANAVSIIRVNQEVWNAFSEAGLFSAGGFNSLAECRG